MSRFNGKRAEFEASGEKINVAILGAGRIAHTMAGTLTQDKVVLEYDLNVNGEDDTRVLRLAYLNSYFQTGY